MLDTTPALPHARYRERAKAVVSLPAERLVDSLPNARHRARHWPI